MKAIIKTIKYKKELDSKFGKLYSFEVTYDDRKAYYYSKYKEQTFFKPEQEAEFTEEERTFTGQDGNPGSYFIIKPVRAQRQSNFGKALTREQSRYSGFADSYAKDMLVAGVLRIEATEDDELHNDIVMNTWKRRAFEIFEHMIALDKSLEQ